MKIEITKAEYRDLLDILSIADWVMTARKSEKDNRIEPYEKLIQKLYSYARDTGHNNLVEYDSHDEKYYFTSMFEQNSRSWEFIDEFTDDAFWDELTYRMTERDMARLAGGYEKLQSLSRQDWSALEAPIRERYDKEFYENGIDNLEIVEHFGPYAAKAVTTHD